MASPIPDPKPAHIVRFHPIPGHILHRPSICPQLPFFPSSDPELLKVLGTGTADTLTKCLIPNEPQFEKSKSELPETPSLRSRSGSETANDIPDKCSDDASDSTDEDHLWDMINDKINNALRNPLPLPRHLPPLPDSMKSSSIDPWDRDSTVPDSWRDAHTVTDRDNDAYPPSSGSGSSQGTPSDSVSLMAAPFQTSIPPTPSSPSGYMADCEVDSDTSMDDSDDPYLSATEDDSDLMAEL